MSASFVVIMILYSAGMACGQVLFKLAATRASVPGAGLMPGVLPGAVNAYLAAGLVLYAGLTLMWVWILRSVPLSKAYPFVALSFIFTPLLARMVFGEPLNASYGAGLLLIACGIVVIARA